MLLKFLKLLHRVYKRCFSPFFGVACRFHPSCSDYCMEAIETHGLIKGAYYSIRRLIRCHPLCEGGLDPVPLKR